MIKCISYGLSFCPCGNVSGVCLFPVEKTDKTKIRFSQPLLELDTKTLSGIQCCLVVGMKYFHIGYPRTSNRPYSNGKSRIGCREYVAPTTACAGLATANWVVAHAAEDRTVSVPGD